MGVITVEHFDIHPGVGHQPAERTKLSRYRLFEFLDDDFANRDHLDIGGGEGALGRHGIRHEKMGNAASIGDERPATLNANARPPERFSQRGERPGTVFEGNTQVVKNWGHW